MPEEVKVTGGTLNLSNGETASFSLSHEYSWQQWGAVQADLFVTMPLVEAIQEKAFELGLFEDGPCQYCGETCDEDNGCDEFMAGGFDE